MRSHNLNPSSYASCAMIRWNLARALYLTTGRTTPPTPGVASLGTHPCPSAIQLVHPYGLNLIGWDGGLNVGYGSKS